MYKTRGHRLHISQINIILALFLLLVIVLLAFAHSRDRCPGQ